MWNRIVSFALGEGPKGTPPERVRWLIVEQQVRSEILIGWVGFALVLFFLVLYTVSPKTSAARASMPVPWVLGAYLGFTLLRLTLAYRRWLSGSATCRGVGSTSPLLLGLIWSFHLQYQQPPSFYLKAPTVLYIFIFIALRALNFDARKVIDRGLVAIGSAGCCSSSTSSTIGPHDAMITHDYVRYLTSNSVLIGAEVDKIISILWSPRCSRYAIARPQPAPADARGHSRARATRTSRDSSRPRWRTHIKTSERRRAGRDPASRARRRVLFLDLEGFTTLSRSWSRAGASS